MVLLEAIGLAAAEVFDYNRENFEQDQEQRIKRDLQRVEMQITRFDLFRQDIEDLVKLTVDKMDMYHLVGALFVGFTAAFYTVGRVHEAVAPPFYLGLYFLSVATSLCYLLLAVWLSMHASISAHSFGVRLRTRYIRLPIPSLSQLAGLAARLADFEKIGVMGILRAPFIGDAGTMWRGDVPEDAMSKQGLGQEVSQEALGGKGDIHSEELLGGGVAGFAGEEVLTSSAVTVPGRHVQLFRKLQLKWQCFDAYARVCMALGVSQISQSIQYYLIGILLLQRRSISTSIAACVVLQTASLGVAVLDIAGIRRFHVFLHQLVSAIPVTVAIVSLSLAPRNEEHVLPKENEYPLGWVAFFVQVITLEMKLWLARPSNDDATLPRRFRTVLFLDVFGDSAMDPTDAEEEAQNACRRNMAREATVAAAERSLVFAWMALRRWEAVPSAHLSREQSAELKAVRGDFMTWRRLLQQSIDSYNSAHGRPPVGSSDELRELRSWSQLTAAEKQSDAFAGLLLGPLACGRNAFDLEKGVVVEREGARGMYSFEDIQDYLRRAESTIRRVVDSIVEVEMSAGTVEASHSTQMVRHDTKKFVQVDRLPWKCVRRITRILQLAWFMTGLFQLLQLSSIGMMPRVDTSLDVERRLGVAAVCGCDDSAQALDFDRVSLREWPNNSLSSPTSVACLPEPAGLLMGSQSLHIQARLDHDVLRNDVVGGSSLWVTKTLPRRRFPAGAAALCASSVGTTSAGAADLCLWGALENDGIALWPFGTTRENNTAAVVLPIGGNGPPWQHLAGATIRCEDARDLVSNLKSINATLWSSARGTESVQWCLVLAGWDGEGIPVAVLPLPVSPSEAPLPGTSIIPYFEIPVRVSANLQARKNNCQGLDTAPRVASIVDMHVESRTGRLWALLEGGEIQAWSLVRMKRVGRWRIRSRSSGITLDQKARSITLCESSRHEPEGRQRLLLLADDAQTSPEMLLSSLSWPVPIDT
eukprot:TRINITY_DN2413_c0_g2_i3.p1 TRINITY_DN2413_c0_g2~~TRINITY_DN2413_c0_g2_i3.p1  ORF type:complete len:985 (-),score=134.72 TRINITY_DN2413_c0_g2_i3:327-3281(-)